MRLTTVLTILLLSIILFSTCEEKKTVVTITVKNSLGIDRALETVEVHKSEVELGDLSEYGLKDTNEEIQLIQYVDEDNDGSVDVILFQPNVAPNAVSKYELVRISEEEKIVAIENCFARFVPERIDDYAWENDKVAFRIFGPKAQQMKEQNVEGGTLSSGIDCWLKRVDYPIINKWYKKHTEGSGSYHEDTGEGLDNFHVGVSRGCGGIAVKKDTMYYMSKNFVAYETLLTGPIRTSFHIRYQDWDADGTLVEESRTITLDLGSNLSKYEVEIKGVNEISAGLTLHENDGELSADEKNGWISYWEPHGDSELGTAIVTDPDLFAGYEKYETDIKDMSNAFMHLKVKNNKTTYYAGFGWKESGQFKNEVEWNKYLEEFSQKLQAPLMVEVK